MGGWISIDTCCFMKYTVKGSAVSGGTSSDATLSGLALAENGNSITLTPGFVTATISYTAPVANAVSQITITPTQNHSGASIEYLDDSNAAISDADSNASGMQVDLDVGANTIKVEVTAQDGVTTATYSVVVTRAGVPIWSSPQRR